MGHIRLGILPTSLKWRQVVSALEMGDDVDSIAATTAEAAETILGGHCGRPCFARSFFGCSHNCLWQLGGPSFISDAKTLGIELRAGSGLLDIAAAFSDALDRYSDTVEVRTDLGEMAQLAAVESLTSVIGPKLPSLLRQARLKYNVPLDVFPVAINSSFSRAPSLPTSQNVYSIIFSAANLPIIRERGRRFATDSERTAFDHALDAHCWEASRIVETFAGGWYGKAVYQKDGLTPESVRRFVPVAFKKIRAELRKRRDDEE